MKLSFFIVVCLLSSVVYSKQSKTTLNDVSTKASEAVETTKAYTEEQKDQFIKEMEDNLKLLNKKITEIKKKSKDTKDQQLSALESKKESMEKDLAQLKQSSGDAWDKLKNGMSKAWKEVKTSVQEAKQEFK